MTSAAESSAAQRMWSKLLPYRHLWHQLDWRQHEDLLGQGTLPPVEGSPACFNYIPQDRVRRTVSPSQVCNTESVLDTEYRGRPHVGYFYSMGSGLMNPILWFATS